MRTLVLLISTLAVVSRFIVRKYFAEAEASLLAPLFDSFSFGNLTKLFFSFVSIFEQLVSNWITSSKLNCLNQHLPQSVQQCSKYSLPRAPAQ